jgi:hypothetical protein
VLLDDAGAFSASNRNLIQQRFPTSTTYY